MHLTPLTNAEFGSTQNITVAGVNDTSTSPWGSKLIGNATGLHYTTTVVTGGTCVIAATGNGAYQGTAPVRNLWGTL